ncbi:MAG: LysM peptidoglycan-binding domain-containing protein [Lentisphaerae bacterium]|nr:LysM peptidoglycan-binding domain-containing protein [Lentisphaerota bacterium]
MIRVFSFIVSVAFILLLASCDEGGSNENRHPLFKKASNLKEKGKYSESAKAFEEYAKVNPDSAKTHLELAILYDDSLKDSFLAIYHYRRCLELEPNSQDKTNIEAWLEGAEKEYYDQLRMNHPDNDLKKELEALREREKRYVTVLTQMRKENESLKNQLNLKPADSLAVQETRQNDTAPAETAVPATSPAKKKEIPEFYMVKQGDSLSRISREIYGDIKYYKLILEANRDIISSETQVQIGQKLKIPKLPEKPQE